MVDIKLATRQDLEFINECRFDNCEFHKVIDYSFPDTTEEDITRVKTHTEDLFKDKSARMYVAFEYSLRVGIIIFKLNPDNTARIIEIFVNEEFREQGIGRMFLAKIPKLYSVKVNVMKGNNSAIWFYEKCGLNVRVCPVPEK